MAPTCHPEECENCRNGVCNDKHCQNMEFEAGMATEQVSRQLDSISKEFFIDGKLTNIMSCYV